MAVCHVLVISHDLLGRGVARSVPNESSWSSLFCPPHCLIGSTPLRATLEGLTLHQFSVTLPLSTLQSGCCHPAPLWRFPIPQTGHQPDTATPTSLFLAAPHVLPQILLVFLRVLLLITMGKQVVGEGHNNRIPTGSCTQVPEISAVSESWLLVYQGDSVWGFLQVSAFSQPILCSA